MDPCEHSNEPPGFMKLGESCKTEKLFVGLYGHKELVIEIVLCFTWILYKLFCFAAWTGLHAKERLWCYAVWNLPVLQASCYQGHVWAYFHDCSSKGELCALLTYVIGFLILLFSFHTHKFMTFDSLNITQPTNALIVYHLF
jgi:hypothetical protein